MRPDHEGDAWAIYNGDCTEILAGMPDECVDLIVTSCPFSALYIYSDSERDMGNSASHDEFADHYRYAAQEMARVLKPGAILVNHVKDVVYYAGSSATGTSGIFPFSDLALSIHRETGLDMRSRTTIWRCPVLERSKSNPERLLYKNIGENARACAPGMPEYLLVLRKESKGVKHGEAVPHATEKWGEEAYRRIARELGEDGAARMQAAGLKVGPAAADRLAELASFPLDQWQEWASPVWPDTRETDVLHGWKGARGQDDERHICPMPLDLIRRAVLMWSNPGDVVLDPFNGIGSTGHEAVRLGRQYIGIELKPEYADLAAGHLKRAEQEALSLFGSAA